MSHLIRDAAHFARSHDRLLDPPDDDGTCDCEVCSGTGRDTEDDTVKCIACDGQGRVDDNGNAVYPPEPDDTRLDNERYAEADAWWGTR